MKKSLLSILAILLVWFTTTYFIGVKSEEEINKHFANIAQHNKQYGDLLLKLQNFEKGFFVSHANLLIENRTTSESMLTEIEIEHGPLFLKHGFGFGLNRLTNQLNLSTLLGESNKTTDEKFFKHEVLASTKLTIGFNTKLYYMLHTTPIETAQNSLWKHRKLALEHLAVNGEVDLNTYSESTHLVANNVLFEDSKGKLQIEHITTTFDFDKFFSKNLYIGELDGELNKLHYTDRVANESFENLNGTLHIASHQPTNETLSIGFNFILNTKEATHNTQPLGLHTFRLNYHLENLDLNGTLAFQNALDKLARAQQKNAQNLQNATDDVARMGYILTMENLKQEMQNIILKESLQMLIPQKSHFAYQMIAEDNSSKSHLDANVTFLGTKKQSHLLQNITLTIDAKLYESLLSLLPQKQAQQLQNQLQLLALFGQVTKKEKHYEFKVDYKPNKLIVNGNDLTHIVLPFLQKSLK
jgi:uncharacterized protein YdgA (DUF945 family)